MININWSTNQSSTAAALLFTLHVFFIELPGCITEKVPTKIDLHIMWHLSKQTWCANKHADIYTAFFLEQLQLFY